MQEFIDYLSSLAGEGETALIVRQKPILENGELQYHKDGAIKCTWPAMLPKKWKPNLPMYGNTASFILDRFKDGKPSASASNCEYILCMVLDDIGTKSKEPPLPPTWVMETSEGCYQWGYVFSEQPHKNDFSAAIVAIAAAGYTDPGAINPVRNWRLPGSVNIKPGRNNFVSRLVSWDKKREYTLDEICTALGVVPEEANTATHRAVDLFDAGGDAVAEWLGANGQVLEQVNGAGWMGVICPNAAEHTDGNPMGRYSPVNRAYCCLHSHCCDWTSTRYLTWVEDQGGPKVQAGIREELVAQTMAKVMDRLIEAREAEGSRFSPESDAEAAIRDVEQKELGRLERDEWFSRFAYIQREDSYFDIVNRNEVSRSAFNALYRHINTKSIHGNHPRVAASISYDECRQAKGARVLESLTYAAGEGELCARDGLVYGNRWRNARPDIAAVGTVSEVSVKPWLDLWTRLIPDDMERNHILDVLSYKVQHPNKKVNHALLISGGHGIGKDTALAPFLWAIGGDNNTNISIVKNDELTSRWGYALEAEVMLINELRQTEAKDRRALENTLKPIIAAPPEYLAIERKGMHPYYALNRILVIAYSNERAPLAIPTEDRRWFVAWSDAERMPADKATELWAWYKAGGFAAIAAYMAHRDVSAFNPGAAPPMTEAKRVMIHDARSGAEEYLISQIESGAGDFAKGVIASPFYGLLDKLQAGLPGQKLVLPALMHALKEAGWVDHGLVKSREYSSRKRVICRPDMADKSKSDLRRLAEEIPAPVMVRVK